MFFRRKKREDEKYDLYVRVTATVKDNDTLQWGIKCRYLGINDTTHREHPIYLEIQKLEDMIREDLGLKKRDSFDV